MKGIALLRQDRIVERDRTVSTLLSRRPTGLRAVKDVVDRGLCTTVVLDCVEVVAAWSVGYYVRLSHRFLLFFFNKKQANDAL
jgi:hypothetical protein